MKFFLSQLLAINDHLLINLFLFNTSIRCNTLSKKCYSDSIIAHPSLQKQNKYQVPNCFLIHSSFLTPFHIPLTYPNIIFTFIYLLYIMIFYIFYKTHMSLLIT